MIETLRSARRDGDLGGVARAAERHERDVREWLGATAAAGIVESDAGARTYRLPHDVQNYYYAVTRS